MSTPRINPNDPKWTAYVLGELDEADARAVERLLESSPEARALISDLTLASAALQEGLDAEPADTLTAAQRAAIRRAADVPSGGWLSWVGTRWSVALTAAATVLIAAVVVQWPGGQQSQRSEGTLASAPKAVETNRQSAEPAAPRSTTSGPGPLASAAPGPPSSTGGSTVPTLTVEPASPLAQAGTATLTGTVRDPSGAVLPGVTVTATDASGSTVSALTDATGRYSFPNVDPGQSYRVTGTLAGFKTASADVPVDRVAAVEKDLTMAVGALAETVTVTGDTPILDTFTSARAARVEQAPAPPTARAVAPPPAAAPRAGGAPNALAASDSFTRGRTSIGSESYATTSENRFVRASEEPLATFSIDVDTASFSNVRRFLTRNQLPPPDAVRVEELINYFTYDYPRPTGGRPIGATMAVTRAPWNTRNRLLRIGVKARDLDPGRRPPSNLVFLVDVSGSMNTPEKLPIVKSALKLLVDQLGENDIVSIVVYASATGLALPPTRGDHKDAIARALDDLQAGGSTNGGAGIQLAYRQATANFIRGGVNRVILMTDGDFNVGVTDQSDLTRLIEERATSGVFLSVLGFGMGNLKDSTMEKLADTGNGHYAYIDTLNEARKVLVEEMSGTLVTVAKDVKIQVDFNPAKVEAYRLIGYENRVLRPEDFNNDLKDAGDMGAGHTVTALFEIVPRGGTVPGGSIDPSVFQPATRSAPPPASNSNDLLVLRVRYKLPDASESTRMDIPLADRDVAFASADADLRFAASVAAFGMILKNSPNRGDATLSWVLDTASASQGSDRGGYRDEFISLVRRAIALSARR
jgi:Ca-activated chloride channel family protein